MKEREHMQNMDFKKLMSKRKCNFFLLCCVLGILSILTILYRLSMTLKRPSNQDISHSWTYVRRSFTRGNTKVKYVNDLSTKLNKLDSKYEIKHGAEKDNGIPPLEMPPVRENGISMDTNIAMEGNNDKEHVVQVTGSHGTHLTTGGGDNVQQVAWGNGNNGNENDMDAMEVQINTGYMQRHIEAFVGKFNEKTTTLPDELPEISKYDNKTFQHENLVTKLHSNQIKSNSLDYISNSYVNLPHDMYKVKENMAGLKFGMPKSGKQHNTHWQVLEDAKEVYLLSAYYDDRPGLDRHMIRVIGIVEANTSGLHCLHWYDKQSYPDVVMAELIQVGPFINPVDYKKYGQYLLSCNIADKKKPPIFVSVVTPQSIRTSTLLIVQWPVKTENPLEFGLCTSVLYWHHDPYRLVEWLEVLKLWGVQEVTAYNNSIDPISSMVFSHYASTGFVDLRQITNVLDDAEELTILMGMSPVINDCMYRNMYRYKFVLSLDLDEMIVPRMHNNYSAMIKAIKNTQSPKEPIMSYMFRNLYFFDDLGPAKARPWYLWTMRYLRHIRPSTYGYSVKSFTDPQVCVGLQNHLCWKKMAKYENMTTWNLDVDRRLGMNHHYKRCHFDSFLEKNGACLNMMKDHREDPSMLRFENVLADLVVKKLLELDMIEKV